MVDIAKKKTLKICDLEHDTNCEKRKRNKGKRKLLLLLRRLKEMFQFDSHERVCVYTIC